MQIQTKCGFSYFLMSESLIIRPLIHKLAGLFRFQFRTAVFTVDGFEIVSVAVAARAFAFLLFVFLIGTKLIINQKVLNIGKDKYKFFIKETVTRSCYARVTFVLRALHVRVPRVTRTCYAFRNGSF